MKSHKPAIVHVIEVIPGQDNYSFIALKVKMEEVPSDGVRRTLKPISIRYCLFGGKYPYEGPGEVVETVCIIDMIIQ